MEAEQRRLNKYLGAIAKRSEAIVNPKNAKKSIWLSLSLGGAITLGTISPAAAQQAITNLNATYQAGTSSTLNTTVSQPCQTAAYATCGANITMQFGVESLDDRQLSSFVAGGQTYSLQRLVEAIALQRVNNSTSSGQKHVVFFESGTTNPSNNTQIRSSALNTMEALLLNTTVNRGADNIFANQGSVAGNNNNIERVDFITPAGISVPSNSLNNVGFLVLERGGNDPFKIAAITSIDASGNPTGFGNLITVQTTAWGTSATAIGSIAATVMRREQSETNLRPSDRTTTQNIGGIYFSLQNLGVTASQTIYGYAIFPNDITVTASNQLVNYSAFPTNTSDASGSGGLDLMAGGGIFAQNSLTTVSGTLYQDNNADNTLNSGDTNLPANVTVRLLDSTGTNTLATTTTNASGQYSFQYVASDSYRIQVDTSDPDISSLLRLSTPNNLSINVSGTPVTNQNFGFRTAADLSLTKVTSNPTPNIGENVTFTITLSNAGPASATGVSVADLLPAGLTYVSANPSQGTYNNTTGVWSVGSLGSGTNATLQVTATVATAGAKTNTAQVSASAQFDPDSTPNNSVATEDDQASVTVTPSSTDLSIVKTDSPDPAIAGTNLTYAIAVTNTGATATNVTMSDPLPAGTTFQSITSPSGWTCTTPAVGSNGTVSCNATSLAVGTSNFTVVVRVAPNTANNSNLSNTATVSSATSDTNTSNNSSTQSTTIQQSADLRLTKVSTPASPAVGETFNYTITVTNDGPSIATNVRVRDALPLGIGYVLNTPSQGTYDPLGTQVWNVGTLNPGASATLTIQAIRNSAASTVNTAEVIGADQNDPDSPHNNQVVGEDDQDSVTVPNQAVDLAVTKTVNNATASVGQNVTFTISVTNPAVSTITATNVGITDVLPQGLTYQSHNASTGAYNSSNGVWSIASLTPGTTATLTLVAQVTTSGAKTNTAQLSTLDQSDPNANNNSSSATVTAAAVPPNLLLVKRITEVSGTPTSGFDDLLTGSKAADDNNANWPTPLATYLRGLLNGGSINPGNEVEYTIYFLNNQSAATNVTICDPIPANMTFVSNGYNSASPRPTEPGALATDTGIALASNAATLPTNPTFYLTNANDSDRGRYYPPNDPSTPAACKRVNAAGSVTATGAAANTDGAIVVNVVSGTTQLPSATASGNPPNSYGFIRFKARVK